MEGGVLRSEPRKLPFVRDGEDVAAEEVAPLSVRTVQTFLGRRGLAGFETCS